jgi:hypothetical protein
VNPASLKKGRVMDSDDQRHTETARQAIHQHFVAVKKDLSQVQALLEEAVSGLLVDTLAISEACDMQQAALISGSAENHSQVLALSKTIDERSKASIMHLQFQDMVSQLLEHAKARLDTVDSLGLIADEKAAKGQAIVSSRTAVSSAASERTHTLARSTKIMNCKPVLSVDMQAGDIELF